MERNSPLFSEDGQTGSSTQAFRLPKTPENDDALGYPARFDQRNGRPELLEVDALDDAGNGITSGNLRFRGIDPTAYLYNMEFGDSAVMAKLKARRLQSFRFGGPRLIELPAPADPIDPFQPEQLTRYMQHVVHNWEKYDFTFAPFSNNDHNGKWESYVKSQQDFWATVPNSPKWNPTNTANFNTWTTYITMPGETGGQFQGPSVPFTVMGIPGAVLPTVTLDEGQLCPLPKLEYVVRTVFKELRLELETDVFDNPEMQRLVLVPVEGVVNFVNDPGSFLFTGTLHISQHLPDLSAAELIRKLMDTFGWHFDASGNRCRLLRAAPLIVNGDPVDITPLAGSNFTVEPQDPVSILVQPIIAERDAYAQAYSEQPDPLTIQAPVATVADLPTPSTAGVHRLVQELRRYYFVEADTVTAAGGASSTVLSWQPASFYLPAQQVGTAESSQDYSVGVASVLTCRTAYANPPVFVDSLCFLEPSYTTITGELTTNTTSTASSYTITTTTSHSSTLRLAFFRGLLPLPGGATDTLGNPATIPWLTQGNLGPDGVKIGELSLEVHGKAGLANQQLLPLLALKTANTVVKLPAYLTARQFMQLDFARMVAVQGNEFMIRRCSLSLPVTKPGQLEMIPRREVASVKSRPTVSDGFYTVAGEPTPTCSLLITTVEKDGDKARILTRGAVGQLRYQLDTGDLQDSNEFTGLVTGRTYTFWAYDMGVVGCHQGTPIIW